jgi:hypothetical protein
MLGEVLEILDVKGGQSELVREAVAAGRSARRSRPITTALLVVRNQRILHAWNAQQEETPAAPPELLPVYGLGDMAAGMASKPCDLLDRHAIIGQQRDVRVPQVPRRPGPANPGTLAYVREHLPAVPGNQRCTGGRGEDPAGVLPMRSGSLPLSRLAHLHSRSAPTAICASFSARRDLGVLVSPPARSARSMCRRWPASYRLLSRHPLAAPLLPHSGKVYLRLLGFTL